MELVAGVVVGAVQRGVWTERRKIRRDCWVITRKVYSVGLGHGIVWQVMAD